MSDILFRQRLEEHNNPEEVRQRLASGNYNQQHARIAQEYLDSLERKQSSEAAARNESREEATLAIANEALSISKEANRISSEDLATAKLAATSAEEQARWARWAAIIATIAAIVTAKDEFVALVISWLP